MAKKRSASRKQAPPQMARWQQLLLLATAVPMLGGLFLFVASWFDLVLFGTPESQTITGALLALVGFAAANAIQGLWWLGAGWFMIAVGVWMATFLTDPRVMWAGVLLGAAGLVVVLVAFARRYRQVRQAQR